MAYNSQINNTIFYIYKRDVFFERPAHYFRIASIFLVKNISGGMGMPGRKYSIANTNYRYGFNGKENDNEVKGEGNQQDYGMRIYDPRLGRFLSTDPLTKKYPELTPYQFASNTPIQAIDLDGAEALFVHGTWSDKTTWGKEFTKNMLKATGWDKIQKQALYGNWSGGNNDKARQAASEGIYDYLVSDKTHIKI